MKLQFKTKAYQSRAVDAVIDCFDGQPYQNGLNYNIDQDMNDQLRGLKKAFAILKLLPMLMCWAILKPFSSANICLFLTGLSPALPVH